MNSKSNSDIYAHIFSASAYYDMYSDEKVIIIDRGNRTMTELIEKASKVYYDDVVVWESKVYLGS